MSEKLVLIDGHSILFRAFYGMPPGMTSPDGTHTNAVYGFLAILHKILEEEQPAYLAACFDTSAPTFRHKIYPEYKGNREKAPEEFHEQVPLMQKILADMEIPVITKEGWEADDLLGTLSREAEEAGKKISVVSGDRDLLQIADDSTEIIIPKTRGGKTTYEHYDPAGVKEAFGVSPADFIQLKALMGDSSDNVPGLPGVGPKTALRIMQDFGSIENAYAHVDEVKPPKASRAMKENKDQLMMSLDLVTIRKNAPVSFDEGAFRLGDIYNAKVYEDFKLLGFKSLLGHFTQTPEKSQETFSFITTSDPAEAEEIVGRAASAGQIGISIADDDDTFAAAGISFDGKTYAFVPAPDFSEKVILSLLSKAAAGAGCTALMETKRFLRRLMRIPEISVFLSGKDGISIDRLFDCVIAAYLLDPLKSDWSYDAIAAAVLHENIPSEIELIGKKGVSAALGTGNAEKTAELAARKASIAMRTKHELEARLEKNEMTNLFREIEMPLTRVLAAMENEGIICREDELEKYGSSLTKRISELEILIFRDAGETFNINSPKQLGHILFEKLGLPGGKKTKTGYSTAADVLEKLSDYPICANILEYRTLTKLKSTYADGLKAFIRKDGRIHTTFHQTITATGRLSSSDPNLQNIPMREELGRLIRKCFYPKEGCVFVDADYSQIELRILAHMSGDEKLIEAYREEKDIHRITASQVFHVPFDEVTDSQRRNAKAVNFGIIYGISSFGLSQGLSISRKEAQEYIQNYFHTFPTIKRFLDGLVASAREYGYAVSLYGRRRPVPELAAKNFAQRTFGERVAMNSPIQGTAADIMKIAMNRVYARLKRDFPAAKILLQIHDELLVEAPAEIAENVRTAIMEEMKNAASLAVPLETDCHIGANWYDAK